MSKNLIESIQRLMKRATQAEILRESRKPYARKSRAHRSEKTYKRDKKVDDCEK